MYNIKRRLVSLALGVMVLLGTTKAFAQNLHTSFFDGGTTLTATCTNTAGSLTSSDVFTGTAQGNTTVTLPAASIGCLDYDVVDLRFTQANGHSYTLTVNAGTGTAVEILSNGGALISAPAASDTTVVLHQIWVYNKVAATPQWELVTQETNPVSATQTTSLGVGRASNGSTGFINVTTPGGMVDSDNVNEIGWDSSENIIIKTAANSIILAPGDETGLGIQGGQVLIENGFTLQSIGGTIPTATCSGGSSGVSIASGSTNNRGQLTTSSSASTNCTITWSTSGAWFNNPFCVFTDANASVTPVAYSTGACSTSTCVVDFVSATSKNINWMCL